MGLIMKKHIKMLVAKQSGIQSDPVLAELGRIKEEARRWQLEQLRLTNPKKWERMALSEFYRRRNQKERV